MTLTNWTGAGVLVVDEAVDNGPRYRVTSKATGFEHYMTGSLDEARDIVSHSPGLYVWDRECCAAAY